MGNSKPLNVMYTLTQKWCCDGRMSLPSADSAYRDNSRYIRYNR